MPDFSNYLIGYNEFDILTMVILCSLVFQILYFLSGYLIFTFKAYTYRPTTLEDNSNLPFSVIFYVEKWHHGKTDLLLKHNLQKLDDNSEFIVLVSSSSIIEAKMLLDTLKKQVGDKLQYSVIHEKVRGFDIGHLALLTGVRMAKNEYISFLRADQVIQDSHWDHVVIKSNILDHEKKQRLFIGYANISKKEGFVNFIIRTSYLYCQMLTMSLNSLGGKFVGHLHHLAFQKKQYLNYPSVTQRDLNIRTLTSTLSHIDRISFRSHLIWDKKVSIVNADVVDGSYWWRATIHFLRRLDIYFISLFILGLFALTLLLSLFGCVWFLLGEDYVVKAAADLFWLLLLLRMFISSTLYILLTDKVEKNFAMSAAIIVYELFIGLVLFPFGLIVWILKPSR